MTLLLSRFNRRDDVPLLFSNTSSVLQLVTWWQGCSPGRKAFEALRAAVDVGKHSSSSLGWLLQREAPVIAFNADLDPLQLLVDCSVLPSHGCSAGMVLVPPEQLFCAWLSLNQISCTQPLPKMSPSISTPTCCPQPCPQGDTGTGNGRMVRFPQGGIKRPGLPLPELRPHRI